MPDGGTSAVLAWETEDGAKSEMRFPLVAGKGTHTYRVILMKQPGWEGRIRRLQLSPDKKPDRVESARLRFFPQPGTGNISSSITILGDQTDSYTATALESARHALHKAPKSR